MVYHRKMVGGLDESGLDPALLVPRDHMLFRGSDGVVVEIERSTFIDDAAHARAVTRALGLAIPALAPDPATNPEVLAARIRSQLQLRGRQGQRRERR